MTKGKDGFEVICSLAELLGYEIESLGFDFVRRAIDSVIANLGGNLSFQQFFVKVKSEPEIRQKLTESLTVPETWFFRDDKPFEYLKKHIRENKDRFISGIRLLSAPCSTGEEPSSIAMLITDLQLGIPFIVDAVDVNSKSIAIAKRGEYRSNSFRTGYAEIYKKYFDKTDEGFALKRDILSKINYARLDLLNDISFTNRQQYDVIFCKNLLIYLDEESRKKLIGRISKLLRPDGILFAGHAEAFIFANHGYSVLSDYGSFGLQKKAITSPSFTAKPREYQSYTATASVDLIKMRSALEVVSKRREKTNFSEVIAQEPINIQEILGKIRAKANSGDIKGAFLDIIPLLKENSMNCDIIFLYAALSFALGKSEIAEEYFNKTLYLNPNHYDAALQLGLLYSETGRLEKGLHFRERAKRIADKNEKRNG